MGNQAIRLQPNLRMMAIIQDPHKNLGCDSFHAVIADADIGAEDFPVYQGLMAMLSNTSYDSPTIQTTHQMLTRESVRGRKPRVELTPREHDILRCYAMGLTNREAAKMLGLSIYTVQTYSSDLLAKLGVRNRQKALLKALTIGINELTIWSREAQQSAQNTVRKLNDTLNGG
jgi:DNA-binding NarL/FixJ family response regulator